MTREQAEKIVRDTSEEALEIRQSSIPGNEWICSWSHEQVAAALAVLEQKPPYDLPEGVCIQTAGAQHVYRYSHTVTVQPDGTVRGD